MMTDTSIITTGAQFAQWARQALHFPEVADSRPFQTLLDTYTRDGKVLSAHPFGDLNILFKDGIKQPYTNQSFLQVVQMAKGINLRLQRTAKGSFQAMCLEEDAEELDLLAELARKHRSRAAPTPKAVDCFAVAEDEYALVTMECPVPQLRQGDELTSQQKAQLATMPSAKETSMDESVYGSDFDLAAMF